MQQHDENQYRKPAEGINGDRHVYAPQAGRAGMARVPAEKAAGKSPVPAFERRAPRPAGGSAGGPRGGKENIFTRFAVFAKGLWANKRTRLNVLIGLLIMVLALAILLVLLVPGCMQRGADTPGSSSLPGAPSQSGAQGNVADPNYDPNADSLPVAQLQGTILAETEDMGQAYVDETLFLGDSNTKRMAEFRDITGLTRQNCVGVESMGITHITSLACVQFQGYTSPVTMVEAVKLLKPRRIVTNFGTNNIGGMNTDDLVDSYKAALSALHEAYPYADIIIGSVFPFAQINQYPAMNMTAIDKLNKGLAELAKQEGYRYLDWGAALKDEQTGYCKAGNMLDDGIHLNQNGMKALFEYFRTHALDTEDKRPMPLGDIPKIQGVPDGIFPRPPQTSSGASGALLEEVPVAITASAGGKIEVAKAQQANFYYTMKPGEAIPQAVAVPDAGYVFSKWQVSGVSLTGRDVTNTTLAQLAVPSGLTEGQSVVITAVFVPAQTYTVTLSYAAGTGGAITPASQVFEKVLPGQTLSFACNAVPGANYVFSGWTASAGAVSGGSASGGSFTVPTDLAADTGYTLTAAFTPKAVAAYTVTLNFAAGTGGAVSPASQAFANVKPGDVLNFDCNAVPGANYAFGSWTASAGSVSGNASGGSFTVPADLAANASYTITANFTAVAPTQYTVTVHVVSADTDMGTASGGGSWPVAVAGGTVQPNAVATALDGYTFTGWSVNTGWGFDGATLTVPALTGKVTVTITANFAAIPPPDTSPGEGEGGGEDSP